MALSAAVLSVALLAVALVGVGADQQKAEAGDVRTPAAANDGTLIAAKETGPNQPAATGQTAAAGKAAVAQSSKSFAHCSMKFPDDKTYGWLYLLLAGAPINQSKPPGSKRAEARGQITVAAGERIMFKANAFLAQRPELLATMPAHCLTGLVLRDLDITDQSFLFAGKLSNLEYLDLEDTDITDASFSVITTFASLQYLSMVSTKIAGSRFSELAKLAKLRTLRIATNHIEHFEGLAALQQLTRLHASQTGVDDATLAFIAKMRNLQYLELRQSPITDKGLRQLIALKHLKSLDCKRTKVTVQGVLQLVGLPLKFVSLDGATAADEKILQMKFPGVRCAGLGEREESAPTLYAPLH